MLFACFRWCVIVQYLQCNRQLSVEYFVGQPIFAHLCPSLPATTVTPCSCVWDGDRVMEVLSCSRVSCVIQQAPSWHIMFSARYLFAINNLSTAFSSAHPRVKGWTRVCDNRPLHRFRPTPPPPPPFSGHVRALILLSDAQSRVTIC